jgi:hypothetical protein
MTAKIVSRVVDEATIPYIALATHFIKKKKNVVLEDDSTGVQLIVRGDKALITSEMLAETMAVPAPIVSAGTLRQWFGNSFWMAGTGASAIIKFYADGTSGGKVLDDDGVAPKDPYDTIPETVTFATEDLAFSSTGHLWQFKDNKWNETKAFSEYDDADVTAQVISDTYESATVTTRVLGVIFTLSVGGRVSTATRFEQVFVSVSPDGLEWSEIARSAFRYLASAVKYESGADGMLINTTVFSGDSYWRPGIRTDSYGVVVLVETPGAEIAYGGTVSAVMELDGEYESCTNAKRTVGVTFSSGAVVYSSIGAAKYVYDNSARVFSVLCSFNRYLSGTSTTYSFPQYYFSNLYAGEFLSVSSPDFGSRTTFVIPTTFAALSSTDLNPLYSTGGECDIYIPVSRSVSYPLGYRKLSYPGFASVRLAGDAGTACVVPPMMGAGTSGVGIGVSKGASGPYSVTIVTGNYDITLPNLDVGNPVVPPYFQALSFFAGRESILIVGGTTYSEVGGDGLVHYTYSGYVIDGMTGGLVYLGTSTVSLTDAVAGAQTYADAQWCPLGVVAYKFPPPTIEVSTAGVYKTRVNGVELEGTLFSSGVTQFDPLQLYGDDWVALAEQMGRLRYVTLVGESGTYLFDIDTRSSATFYYWRFSDMYFVVTSGYTDATADVYLLDGPTFSPVVSVPSVSGAVEFITSSKFIIGGTTFSIIVSKDDGGDDVYSVTTSDTRSFRQYLGCYLNDVRATYRAVVGHGGNNLPSIEVKHGGNRLVPVDPTLCEGGYSFEKALDVALNDSTKAFVTMITPDKAVLLTVKRA